MFVGRAVPKGVLFICPGVIIKYLPVLVFPVLMSVVVSVEGVAFVSSKLNDWSGGILKDKSLFKSRV